MPQTVVSRACARISRIASQRCLNTSGRVNAGRNTNGRPSAETVVAIDKGVVERSGEAGAHGVYCKVHFEGTSAGPVGRGEHGRRDEGLPDAHYERRA